MNAFQRPKLAKSLISAIVLKSVISRAGITGMGGHARGKGGRYPYNVITKYNTIIYINRLAIHSVARGRIA